ncbi:MAG: hypothetical protein ACLUYS_00135 [Allobaculum sp.]|uniref:hypothetical protein n=1 Tax=Allobaculum sp. TaxID=1872463 RepID=UPI00399B2A3A
MLTVIIYPRSAQRSFDQHKLLFENSIEKEKVCFCFWDENGEDFYEALPDLKTQLEGVKNWRAIVVDPIDGTAADHWELDNREKTTQKGNPFDYIENDDLFPLVHKSKYALIRLSQMLGGIPDISLEATRRKSMGDDDYQILLDQQKALYDKLSEQSEMPIPKPDEIFLFRTMIESESDSISYEEPEIENIGDFYASLFWQRNRYPAACRFLTFRQAKPDTSMFQESMFRFWLTVLLLAEEEFPAGTFEAYRLYEMSANASEEVLKTYFEEYLLKMNDIRFFLQQEIDVLHSVNYTSKNLDTPDLERSIPVDITLTSNDDIYIPRFFTGPTGDLPRPELPAWKKKVRVSRRAFRKVIGAYERSVERSCQYAHQAVELESAEELNFNSYQIAAIREETADYEHEVLSGYTPIMMKLRQVHIKLKERDKVVQKNMSHRMYSFKALAATAVCICACFLGVIPFVAYCLMRNQSMGDYSFLVYAASIGMLIFCIAVIVVFWVILGVRIFEYNYTLDQALHSIEAKIPAITQYLKNCCASIRGNRIVYRFEKENNSRSNQELKCLAHIKAIDNRAATVKSWMNAFNIWPGSNSRIVHTVIFDLEIPPERNPAYLLEEPEDPVFVSFPDGTVIHSPFPFVTSIDKKRLEPYEMKVVEKSGLKDQED